MDHQYLKKLKTILLFSIIISTVIYCIIVLTNNKIYFNYALNTEEITGRIIDYSFNGNQLKMEIKAKNKIIGVIYAKTEQQLKQWKEQIKLGLTINIKGNLKEINGNTNFHLFNYRKYLYSKKIYYMFEIKEWNIIKKESCIYSIKNQLKKRVEQLNPYVNLFIFGDNSLDEDKLVTFRKNGISHLLAISGMHITLFTTILMKLLNKINEKKKGIIIIIFLFFYLFLTNWAVSVTRASFLFICLFIKKTFHLNISTMNIMLFLITVFLLYSPYLIYNIGFLFSFSISFALILFSSVIKKYKNYFSKMLITSLISFLIGLPIMINNFFEVNFLSPIINLFFIPFVSFLLFPLSFITFLIPVFNPILDIVSYIFELFSLLFSKINFLTFSFSHLNLPFFILYYIIIILFIINLKNKKYWFFIIILFIIHHNIQYFILNTRLLVFDVGQGDCILITLPNAKGNILIDTGGKISYKEEDWKKKKDYSIAENIIIPYLKSVGVNKIDYLILTHGDFDHMGESINLANKFRVDKVILNCGDFNELENNLIRLLDKKKIKYYSSIKELDINGNKFYFLNNKVYENENDNSLIIYTVINKYKFLFMGDASIEVEEDLVKQYNLQDIDVLKVGHHGSKTSSSKNFINITKPKYSIISVGENNRYGHPNSCVLDNLKNSKIYRTDQNGSIMFKISKNKLKIETCITY